MEEEKDCLGGMKRALAMRPIKAGENVLELGCNNKTMKKFFLKDCNYVGVDNFNDSADVKHDLNVFPYPFENNSFDVIFCLQTLEHVENPRCAMLNLIDATQNLLIIGVPYRNRRPDENHFWSFDENDFSELTDSYCLDKKQRNVYWLVDKQKKGFSFCKKRFRVLRKLAGKFF